MNQPQLFESTPEGKRRSVLFSIAVMTGFISVVAGVATFVGTNQASIGLALALIGVAALLFAVFVYLGRGGGLVDQKQLFWRFLE